MMLAHLRQFSQRFASFFRRAQLDRDLDAEMASHLELAIEENLRSGMTHAEARRQALIHFGGVEQAKEQHRDSRSLPFLETLLQDLRFGLRMLRKSPAFTGVAVFTLALGIGANSAIFSVVNSVLIKPLPYPDSQKLVQVYETMPGSGRNSVSGGAFKDWHGQSSRFAHLAVYEQTRLNLTGDGTPERVSGLMVSSEFLSVLGVVPAIGRGFAAGEDAVGGNNRVIVLTHQLWQRRFGNDFGVIGRTLSLDQVPYMVIGVLPPNALLQDDALFLIPDVIDAPGVNWERAGHWR